ncbi:MAG: malonate transporter subunit MadM, partial [Clostridia bacterium]|nr:malonate transporter subunit MadM [Clostridia bacterium]
MRVFLDVAENIFIKNGLVMSFLIVGVLALVSNFISAKITRGRIHSSAIAIFFGLVLAYIGGKVTVDSKGLSDIGMFAGVGVLGGSSLRDFAI